MTDFLPKDYTIPPTVGNYMKFKAGDNQFRILSPAITGYEYWNTSNKPVRSEKPYAVVPKDIRPDTTIKHFWAFKVFNYSTETVQILEITQKTILTSIKAYADNKKWGNPTGYDLVVTKVGDGLDTEYAVIAEPHSKLELTKEQEERAASIKLEALYVGEDPFNSITTNTTKAEYPTEDIKPEDIPF